MMDTPDVTTDTDDATDDATEQRLERTDDFRRLFDLIALISSEKNLKARVREFQRSEARAVAAQERLAAERAAFDAYEEQTRAELAAAKQAHDDRETKISQRDATLDERQEMLLEMYRDLRASEEALKRRVLAFRGIDVLHDTNFCPLPDWPEIDLLIGETDRAQPAGDSVTVRPEHSPADSTLTQTFVRPAGARGQPSA